MARVLPVGAGVAVAAGTTVGLVVWVLPGVGVASAGGVGIGVFVAVAAATVGSGL